jgi:hypothetical protein
MSNQKKPSKEMGAQMEINTMTTTTEAETIQFGG